FGALQCVCGCRDQLSTCSCENADEAREKIREKMRAGESRDAIIAEYEAEHGIERLSVPPNRGVLKAIWIVPVVGIAFGAFGLARMMRRWRRASPDATAGETVS